MSRFFSSLFGSQTATTPPASGLRVNTSLQGVPIALILGGQMRMSVNLIDYYGFKASSTSQGGGGKGGLFAPSSTQTVYSATVVMAICEGPIKSLQTSYVNGTLYSISEVEVPGETPLSSLGSFEVFLGDYSQLPWTFTDAANPAHARAYRGISYVGGANFNLGTTPSLPNFTFEVKSTNSDAMAGQPDGDITIATSVFLAGAKFSVGFPVSRIGSFALWQQYCLALGLVASPVLASAQQASSAIDDWCNGTNSAACWQDGQLTVVPYGDQAVAVGSITSITETHLVPHQVGQQTNPPLTVGFAATFVADQGVIYQGGGPLVRVGIQTSLTVGTYYVNTSTGVYYFSKADINAVILVSYTYAATASYAPNTQSLYDFTIDDTLPNQGSVGSGSSGAKSPFVVVRKARDQIFNNIKAEYLDRQNYYNPVNIEVKDEASITAFGRERPSDIKQLHFFCLASAAQQSASLMLARQSIINTYQWTVGRHFLMILELMALCTITETETGMSRKAVRIIEIAENQDFSITITAEDYPGTLSAPLYGTEAAQGAVVNLNEDPGSINTPLIFEPTDELGGGLQIWAALSGQDTDIWGGCNIYVATTSDGTYAFAGRQQGAARMGVTTADFPTVTPNLSGQTVDQRNVLSVDVSESDGTINTATPADALALADPCYVDGEIVSYANAVLTGPNAYGLSYMVRGAFGTEDEIVDHPSGSRFARLDNAIFKFPYQQAYIGTTLYFKFCSFNIYGGGLQTLDEVGDFPYVVQGTALTSPLPSVEGLYTNYASGFQQIFWTEIVDFRNGILYEIRQGTVWETALFLKTQAHPPFIAQGNGTFLIKARCQPIAGLIVYSELASSISISGNQLSLNLLAGFDEKTTGWEGTFELGIGIDAPNIRLMGDTTIGRYQTNGSTAASSNVLHFALISTSLIQVGMVVADTTSPSVIPANTVVTVVAPTAVTISNPVTGGGVNNGDTITFSAPSCGSRSGAVSSTAQKYNVSRYYQGGAGGTGDGGAQHVATPHFVGSFVSPPASFNRGLIQNQGVDSTFNGGIVIGTPVYYTIPVSHIIDAGSVVPASVNATTLIIGQTVGDNILVIPDILSDPDILGASSTEFVDGWVEIATAQEVVVTNLGTSTGGTVLHFASLPADVVSGQLVFDLDASVVPEGTTITNVGATTVTLSHAVTGAVGNGDRIGFFDAWQRFVPGIFPAMAWNFRLALETINSSTLAYGLAFNYAVQLPSRVDHYQNQTVTNSLTITFQRDGSSVAGPFNGGPGSANLPYVSVAWQATAGDTYTITGLSKSQLTINFFNGGPVTRTGVNITVEGY